MKTIVLESAVIGQFHQTLRDTGAELPFSQTSKPVLCLRCWGSDYPYLQGVEQQRRWLPVAVHPTAGI